MKETCDWHELDDGLKANCREGGFRSSLPVWTFSYCPYCGKWLAVHTKPRMTIIEEASNVPREIFNEDQS